MDRRQALIVLAGLVASVASAEPSELTNLRDLDIEVREAGSGAAWKLPQLLQRRGVLVAIEGGSRGAAAWLAHQLPKLQPGQLDMLVVLLVDRRRPDAPLLVDATLHPGLRLYRTTGALWPQRAVGIALPQIFGFDDDGALKSRLIGSGTDRPGIAEVMAVMDL